MRRLEILVGSSIDDAATEVLLAAVAFGEISVADFNGIDLWADPDDTEAQVLRRYYREKDRRLLKAEEERQKAEEERQRCYEKALHAEIAKYLLFHVPCPPTWLECDILAKELVDLILKIKC